MERRKLASAALFLVVLGVLLIMPPFTMLFDAHVRVASVPVKMLYLFGVWAVLIGLTRWLARRLSDEGPAPALPPEGES